MMTAPVTRRQSRASLSTTPRLWCLRLLMRVFPFLKKNSFFLSLALLATGLSLPAQGVPVQQVSVPVDNNLITLEPLLVGGKTEDEHYDPTGMGGSDAEMN